eukprot:CAMPEP_0170500152 /NCGR_PEP_ID=MMETSP0208-20121228/33883_1 /TAXON_ID=197538 /ORGANISM="Strombidium inclinatum, Strain S3" /LENGTH=140 /DNA_ID=CAMNT_0010778053 /DNA_START=1318 /DNA_END=1737 /DNA_ORIENTATION=-
MQTAALLNIVTAENPWSMGVQFTNPVVMLVMNGIMCVDVFFAVSAFLSFFQIQRIYEKNNGISIGQTLWLFVSRFLRFAPAAYIVMFIGIYVMPKMHGGPGREMDGNPIWNSYETVLFYQCTEPKIMASKLLMYSNLYPW